MQTVTVSKKGWVVIPSEMRKRLKIKPGDKLQVIDYGGHVSFAPVMDPYEAIRTSRGMIKDGPSLTKALEEERRKEREREEEKIRQWGPLPGDP